MEMLYSTIIAELRYQQVAYSMITFLVQQQTLAISCKVLQKLVYIIYNKIKKDKLQISIEVCFAPSW